MQHNHIVTKDKVLGCVAEQETKHVLWYWSPNHTMHWYLSNCCISILFLTHSCHCPVVMFYRIWVVACCAKAHTILADILALSGGGFWQCICQYLVNELSPTERKKIKVCRDNRFLSWRDFSLGCSILTTSLVCNVDPVLKIYSPRVHETCFAELRFLILKKVNQEPWCMFCTQFVYIVRFL